VTTAPLAAPAIGLNMPTWPRADRTYASWPEIRSLARDAEALGVDTLWVPDHLQRDLRGGERIGFWECWTIVTALAEATTRVGIGPYVACTGFRNPALLARMAATLDEVSGGRLVLGLGSGVPERDTSWRAFGFDATRPVGRYAEAVEIVVRMLREPAVTFEGEHFHTDDAQVLPRAGAADAAPAAAGPLGDGTPSGRPLRRPPVWVAGLGERTSRVAAAWGDAINVNLPLCGPADMQRIADTATAACEAVGRDPATLELTGWGRLVLDAHGTAVAEPGCLAGSPGEVAETVRGFAAAGLRHMTFYVGSPGEPSRFPALTPVALERFARVLEALRAN
jgi:alkanesulfonate monooxygenase SsuD/methylene tetrahydromethanopterin reductase-like flavin-dependent oxidoreductase (luciferase family)